MEININWKRPIIFIKAHLNKMGSKFLYLVHFVLLSMKQIYVKLLYFLLFATLTWATREFKKSYIAEFNARWPTLRAQSQYALKIIDFKKTKVISVFLAVMQLVLQ